MSYSLGDIIYDSIEVEFFQLLDPMSLKVCFEFGSANEKLATDLDGGKRIDRRIYP
jgi:hypothetical protein